MLVSFSIGRYKNEVLCDIVPMHAGHILLGRPWQFDRKVNHDGFKNKYSFVKDNKTITLVPLAPRQVYGDQMKLKRENDLQKNCDTKDQKKMMRKRVKQKKSEQKKESENKKESEKKIESGKNERKTKKQRSFYAKASDIKNAFYTS